MFLLAHLNLNRVQLFAISEAPMRLTPYSFNILQEAYLFDGISMHFYFMHKHIPVFTRHDPGRSILGNHLHLVPLVHYSVWQSHPPIYFVSSESVYDVSKSSRLTACYVWRSNRWNPSSGVLPSRITEFARARHSHRILQASWRLDKFYNHLVYLFPLQLSVSCDHFFS